MATTKVATCTTTACAYNHDGCTALGITIGGADAAVCTTFITLDARGGADHADGTVGACQRLECKYNEALLCNKAGIEIAGDTAKCTDYEVA